MIYTVPTLLYSYVMGKSIRIPLNNLISLLQCVNTLEALGLFSHIKHMINDISAASTSPTAALSSLLMKCV